MRSLIAIATLALLAQDAPKALDNPEYAGWAGFKPGSWVEYRESCLGEPHPPDHTNTFTLVETTGEKAVVRMNVRIRRGDEKSESTHTYEIPAKFKAGDGELMEKGEEELEVNGKKVTCPWEKRKFTIRHNNKDIKGWQKIWSHDEIPGRIAKSQSHIDGQFDNCRVALRWEKK